MAWYSFFIGNNGAVGRGWLGYGWTYPDLLDGQFNF